jgi:general secretion pathway protein D
VQWVGATGNSTSTYRVGALQSFAAGTTNNIGAIATGGGKVLPTWAACRSASSSRSTARWAWARWRALESDGNANILSTPNLITLDNELATIVVGQNVPS